MNSLQLDPWILATAWVLVGTVVAWALAARGHPQEAVLTSLVAWPFLLPALSRTAQSHVARGPQGARIDRGVGALLRALHDVDACTPGTERDLDQLCRALHAADRRIGRVELLLAEPVAAGDAIAEERRVLCEARDRARADLDAVLASLAQLRLQVGRLALAGDEAPVGRRLGELRARVAALTELAPAR